MNGRPGIGRGASRPGRRARARMLKSSCPNHRESAAMSWFYLFIAGLFEIAWVIGLKYTDGFTRPLPSIATAAALTASMVLLGLAVR
ncbi:MAG: SMR family transporter, partial [Rhodospirillales bacterium]